MLSPSQGHIEDSLSNPCAVPGKKVNCNKFYLWVKSQCSQVNIGIQINNTRTVSAGINEYE